MIVCIEVNRTVMYFQPFVMRLRLWIVRIEHWFCWQINIGWITTDDVGSLFWSIAFGSAVNRYTIFRNTYKCRFSTPLSFSASWCDRCCTCFNGCFYGLIFNRLRRIRFFVIRYRVIWSLIATITNNCGRFSTQIVSIIEMLQISGRDKVIWLCIRFLTRFDPTSFQPQQSILQEMIHLPIVSLLWLAPFYPTDTRLMLYSSTVL